MCDMCYTIQKEAWDWEKRYYELLGEKNAIVKKHEDERMKISKTIHQLVASIEILSGKIETMGETQIPRR